MAGSALALIIPLATLLMLATLQYVVSERDRLESDSLEENIGLGIAVEQDLITLIAALRSLAVSLRYDNNLDLLKTQAREALADRRGDLMLIDEEGHDRLGPNPDALVPAPFMETMRDDDPASGEVEISDLLPVAGTFGRRVAICIPVATASKAKMVLVFAVRPDHFTRILQIVGLGPPYLEAIVDRSGTIIARQEGGDQFVGQKINGFADFTRASGKADAVSIAGVPLRRFYRRSPLSGWFVLTSVSSKTLHAPLWRSLRLLGGITVVLVVTAFPVATVLTRRMRSATAITAAAAQQLGRGEEVVPQRTGVAETDIIHAVLTGASIRLRDQAISLKEANRHLEQRVAQRSRQLAESHVLTNSILDSSPDMIEVLDDRGCLIFANNIGQRVRRSIHEPKSAEQGWTELWPSESRTLAEEAVAKARHGTQSRFTGWSENTATRRDWYDVLVTPMKDVDGDVQRILVVSRNITDRYLQDRELEDAKERAEAASKAKAEFLATMSHEIRTPLNGILGYVDLLSADAALSDMQRFRVERAHDAAMGLLHIVNDVLDLAKIDAGEIALRLRTLVLRDEIETAIAIIAPIAHRKMLTLDATLDPTLPRRVMADPERLRQVLLNLLSNAVKFTDIGGVSLSVTNDFAADGHCLITIAVADTGIGIPDDLQPLLFRRFSQVDTSSERRFGGTGLGLAISRHLIEQMGGTIQVDSQPGRGSVFKVSVTVRTADGDGAEVRRDGPTAIDFDASVLVVEDNKLNQEVVADLLRAIGCSVEVVSSGADAIEAVQDRFYDLVLMDEQMPGMAGTTATRAIRALPHPARDVVIVGCSANVLSHQVHRFEEAGTDGFVAKPLTRAALVQVLLKHVPNASAPASRWADAGARDTGTVLAPGLSPDRMSRALTDMRRELLGLQVAAVGSDPGAAALAHHMISSASILGFDALGHACRDFEQACREAREIGETVISLCDAIEASVGRIDELLAADPPTETDTTFSLREDTEVPCRA